MIIRILMMGAILVVFVLMVRKMPGLIGENSAIRLAIDDEGNIYWPESDKPVIQHSTYTLAYDENHEQAVWVAYVLTRSELNRKFVSRSDWFEEDKAVPTGSADFYDYKGSGYTKGHLVPSADRAWSRSVNDETFLMSNISPQTYHFNGGVWRELEENVRDWARSNDRLFIVTGPVIGNSREKIGQNQVTVPEAFFKVLIDVDNPEMKSIGFLVPNNKTDRPLPEFAMSVDDVEEIVGIDFFNRLIADDALEESLESSFNISKWPLDKKRYRTRVDKWNK